MRTASFGLGLDFQCDNQHLGIAMSRYGIVTVEEDNYDKKSMYYRIGELANATVLWQPPHDLGNGKTPQIGMSDVGILEVHESEDPNHAGDLWYSSGWWDSPGITWPTNEKYDTGHWPTIAVNNYGEVVEMHEGDSDGQVYYRLGTLQNYKITWMSNSAEPIATGTRPRVAINDAGVIVMAFESGNNVLLGVAQIAGNAIALTDTTLLGYAGAPSVALTADSRGVVLCEMRTPGGDSLVQMTFEVSNYKITATSGVTEFDSGRDPAVAVYGAHAVRVAEYFEEWSMGVKQWGLFSTSLIVDRSSWMMDAQALQNTPIRNIAFPAAHDAGMYTGGLSTLAKAQDENLYAQALDGIRWFDLRPGVGTNGTIYIYPENYSLLAGPTLYEVLDSLSLFLSLGTRELLFLKFSHFSGWSASAYSELAKMVTDKLGRWLYTTKPADKRLSDLTLNAYTASGAKVVVVVDEDWAINDAYPGFYVYRTASGPGATTPSKGDLRVFDDPFTGTDYNAMELDQFGKFQSYDGYCADGSLCDLFLLSWTLKPYVDVWSLSTGANSHLGNDIGKLQNPNSRGFLVNQIYVDYAEYARPLDVTMYLNHIAPA